MIKQANRRLLHPAQSQRHPDDQLVLPRKAIRRLFDDILVRDHLTEAVHPHLFAELDIKISSASLGLPFVHHMILSDSVDVEMGTVPGSHNRADRTPSCFAVMRTYSSV